MFLGRGSYGEVNVKNGLAVKKFIKLSHLTQEYIALHYLQDCKYIVHSVDVDFATLELSMELYDCSLRKYLEDNDNFQLMKIIHDILCGLVELHDRELVHGDIKPGNILIKENPFKIVLGDCGFVSIAKYAKVERTAAVYRDTVVGHDYSHDMFSLGICFLEMITKIKISRQPTYTELLEMIRDEVREKDFQRIIYNLIREDRKNRTTARELLLLLFKENPPRWLSSLPEDLVPANQKYDIIRKLMKINSHDYKINRPKKGYRALIYYINKHDISPDYYKIYTLITIMILSSVFGNTGFKEQEVLHSKKYTIDYIHKTMKEILSDRTFVSFLFAT